MLKFIEKILGILAFILAFSLFLILNFFLVPLWGAGMIIFDLVYIIAGLILISCLADVSIPFVKTLLKREYFRVKFKFGRRKSVYLKFLATLIILFKSAQDGYEVIREEAEEIHGRATHLIKKEKEALGPKISHPHFFQIHKAKQRRAASISAGTLILLVITTVITGLLASLIFPAIFQSRAADSYTWTQKYWSGGTSTAVATHSGDAPQQDWVNYQSADSNISISALGNITLDSGAQTVEDISSEDFNLGETSNNISEVDISLQDGEVKLTSPWACGDTLTYSGQDYSTVEINGECWLAENLNVGTKVSAGSGMSDDGVIEKYCHSDGDCSTYGGYYLWDEAMAYSTTEGAQGICPDGWHIPTDAELHALEDYYADGSCDGTRNQSLDCSPAGTELASGGSSGMNVLLAGIYFGGWQYEGQMGYMPSSLLDSDNTPIYYVQDGESGTGRVLVSESDLNSAGATFRCLKD